jgi:hypothetical protein
MAISGEPGLEERELPGGGEEEDAVFMAFSDEPDLDVSEPPGGGEEDVAPMAIRCEPNPEVGDPLGGGEEDFAPMAASGEQIPEEDEPPGGGEKDAVTMDISGKSGPEVGEPSPTWKLLFASSSARSGNPFSPSARVGDSSAMRCSSASEVFPTASPKDNKVAPSIHSCSKKADSGTDGRFLL